MIVHGTLLAGFPGTGGSMAEQWKRDESDLSGRMDEENRIRGVVDEGDDEFEETDDLDAEEEDEESTTF
jgi:hypothetical protein